MKKLGKVLALLLALVMCLSVTVLAEGERTPNATCADLFNVYAENGANVEVVGEKINVSMNTSESGYFLVVVKCDDGQNPNEDNIIYIDQAAAADGAVAFSVYASGEEGTAEDCIVMVYGPGLDGAGVKVATVECLTQIGDVDKSKAVNVGDVTMLLRYLAGLVEDASTVDLKAADTDKSGAVNVGDVTYLLRVLAGLSEF